MCNSNTDDDEYNASLNQEKVQFLFVNHYTNFKIIYLYE